MVNYVITVSVDEDLVKKASGINDVLGAVTAEAGWMEDSGIYVEHVEKAREE